MAPRKPAEDDLPATKAGRPIDQWLRFQCLNYEHSEKPPPPEFVRRLMRYYLQPPKTPDAMLVRRLMRFNWHSGKTPPPELVQLLMRCYRKDHPPRRLSPKEIAAMVDHFALIQPSVLQAIAHVAEMLTITENRVAMWEVYDETANRWVLHKIMTENGVVLQEFTKNEVEYAHRKYGRPVAELNREREALRVKWTEADDSKKWIAERLLEQTIPTKIPGRPKGAKNRH